MTVRLGSLHAFTDRAMAPPQRPRRDTLGGYHGCVIDGSFGEQRSARPRFLRGRGRFLRQPVLAVALSR